MQAALRHFACGIEAWRIGSAVHIHKHAAAGIMLRGHDWDWLPRDVDAKPKQLFVDVREMRFYKFGWLVANIQMDIIQTIALDLGIIGARDNITRRKLSAFVIIRHVAMSGFRVLQYAALTADSFGDEKIFDVKIVEAGRVELHEFHVRHTAACTPCHGDAISSRAAWGRRI